MRYQSTILSTLLVLFVAQVSSDELMCYVCDDCAKVNDDTPLLPCDASYFNQGGTTEASTLTTSPMSSTTDEISTEEMSTTTPSTTTSTSTTTSSTTTTDMTTTDLPTESTEAPIPTPPTVGPIQTTTPVPTPPNVDTELNIAKNTELNDQPNTTVNNSNTEDDETTIRSIDTELVQNSDAKTDSNATIISNSNSTTVQRVNSELPTTKLDRLSRRRRALNDVTYHCYSVLKKNATGNLTTVRGCSRVTTMESVCNVLNTQNPGVELSDCNPCSMPKCNGSSALSVSLLAIAVALLAGLLQRN